MLIPYFTLSVMDYFIISNSTTLLEEEVESEGEEEIPPLVTLNTLKQRAEAIKREPPTTDESKFSDHFQFSSWQYDPAKKLYFSHVHSPDESEYTHKPPNKRSKTSSPKITERKRSVSDEKPSKVSKVSEDLQPARKKSREPKVTIEAVILYFKSNNRYFISKLKQQNCGQSLQFTN